MKTQHFIGPKAHNLMMVIHSFHKADIKQTNKENIFFEWNKSLLKWNFPFIFYF